MIDVELVLRFMAFNNLTYLTYPDKKTKEFLNREMKQWQNRPKKDHERAVEAFKGSVVACLTVYSDRAFRRYDAGEDAENVDGKWVNTFNRALYDVQMYGFTKYQRGTITKHADAIREASIDLMSNPVFSDLVSHTISEKRRVERRFSMWLEMLDRTISDEKQGPRIFPQEIKRELFNANPKCTLCNQTIQTIDDAHVDHIVAWSQGGTTTRDNAAIAHRYCNQAAQAK